MLVARPPNRPDRFRQRATRGEAVGGVFCAGTRDPGRARISRNLNPGNFGEVRTRIPDRLAMRTQQMNQHSRGLSEEQDNDCRAALHEFVKRHKLSAWGLTVKVQESAEGKYVVRIEMTPTSEFGLPEWPVQEIAVADESFDIAAEVDKKLEIAYETFSKRKA